MDIKLNIFQVKALLTFLKDYCTASNLSSYQGTLPKQLLLAFVALQKANDEWQDKMGYTE